VQRVIEDGSAPLALRSSPKQYIEVKGKKLKDLDREQIILWAMDAGFNPGFVRMNVRDFEKFARLVEWYTIDKEKESKDEFRNSKD